MPDRERLRHQHARRPAVVRRSCVGRCEASAERDATAQGQQQIPPHRPAARAPGYTGEVQWQRDLWHRRRGPGNAERRHQHGAGVHRKRHRNQERGGYSEGARRARSREAAGHVDRRRARGVAATTARECRLRDRRLLLAGQARARRSGCRVRRRQPRRPLDRHHQRRTRHRADVGEGCNRAAARQSRGGSATPRCISHRAALRAAAHRACAARAGKRNGELQGRHGRGLGAGAIGHGLPGGRRAVPPAARPTT